MPRSPRRPQPRHLDSEGLRLTTPSKPLSVALLGVALVLAVLGVGVLSGGAIGQGSAALKADPVSAKSSDPGEVAEGTSSSSDPPASEPEAAAPARYRVVEAVRIEPAPEPKKKKRLDLAKRAEKAQQAPPSIPDFGVAMLNILGSNHTKGGKGGFAPGTSRAHSATQMLLARGASIIGFSEIQRDQLAVFTNNAPGYGVYPGTAVGSAGIPTTVAWDTGVWSLVEAHTVTIPFSGQQRPAPVVKLAHVSTGAEIWVMNIHNSPNGMEAERERAEAIEIAKVRELEATGIPIIVTGDFNEKQEALCDFTATTLQSAVGGGYCFPPPQPMRVDWIFASEAFSVNSWDVTRAAPVPYITDHAALFARLSLR
ncbi:endonuclease/exonuclease/phosphatase family protein [Nocardioides sp.]|uniref:endonuclease/exonuclease/phosphatase family protein n=1 Tax=Nocardioides sp. TaxID=35761 RepID=UPI002ED396CB